jgi:hypothetical protein
MTDRKEVEQHFSLIIEAARAHYEDIKADIPNAANRIEYIRLTTLANSAHKLLTDIELFEIGLVYTRVASVSMEDMERYQEVINSRQKLVTGDPSDVPLDLPEFKSPFTPPGSTH